MNKGSFFFLSLITLLMVMSITAQRTTPAATAEERREQREIYNRRIEDPKNNPYIRAGGDVRIDPKQISKPGVLRLEPPRRSNFESEVLEVVDGDTVAIANSLKQRVVIRLLGIDAPEIDQEFGAEARKNLADKIAGKKVLILFEPRGVPDEKGRILAKVVLEDRDICAEQVRDGFAWYFDDHKERLGIMEIDEFKDLESAAKKGKIQLWQNRSPQAPWKFRKQFKISS